jgi:WD40 repeat protein
VRSSQVNADNPWPGLEAFEENARAFFRGRDREAESLLKRVLDVPVTVLYGRSGLGKTSLLRAGLFPLLRERNFLPIYVRFDVKAGAAPLADQLHQSVSQAIRAELPNAMLPGDQESVWEYLHRSDFELWSAQNYPLTPVIVLDQFEELFTLGERVPDLVEKFRNDLGDLAENRITVDLAARIDKDPALAARFSLRSLNYKVLISLREDFLADLEGWRRLIPALGRSRMRLQPLTADDAFDAVYTPAGAMMTEELAHRVVGIIAGEDLHRGGERALRSGARVGEHRDVVAVEPALLSLFCRELNEERKRQGRKQFDSAMVEDAKTDILSNYYLSCVQDLPGRVADFIESELITEKGFRNSYPHEDAVPEHLTEDELTGLIRLRLLRIEDRYGTPRIELTHDVLTGIVREQRDRRRLEKEKAALAARAEQERQELAEQAAEREAELEKERQHADLAAARDLAAVETRAKEQAQAYAARLAARTRVLRIAVAVAGVVVVIAAGLGVAALRSSKKLSYAATALTTVLRLTANGQSPSAVQRPGGEYRALQEISAAYSLAPGAQDALFNTVVSRGELSRLVWMPGAQVTRFSSADPRADPQHVVAVNNEQCTVRVWTLATADPLGPAISPEGFSGCRFIASRDGRRIWMRHTGVNADVVQVWDSVTGKPSSVSSIPTGQGNVVSMAISPDGRRLYTGGTNGTIAIWDSQTGARIGDPVPHGTTPVTTVKPTADQRRLVSAGKDGTVRVWEISAATPTPVQFITAGLPLNDVAASADGQRVLTAGSGVEAWDVGTGSRDPLERTIAEGQTVDTVAVSSDGNTVLTGGSAGKVQRWNAETGSPLGDPISNGYQPVYFAEFGDAGSFNYSTMDGTLRVRQIDPDWVRPPGQDQKILVVAISPDGRRIATAAVAPGSKSTTLRVRDVDTGEDIGPPVPIGSVVHRLAFSRDGSHLVSGDEDGDARIWNASSGAPVGDPMPVTTGDVWALAVSPDGGTIVTGDSGGELRMWNSQTQKPLDPDPVLGKHDKGEPVTGVAFSSDGQRLVSGGWDNKVRVWDLRTRKQIGEIDGGMPVLSVAISPDGKRVAAGLGQGHGNRDDHGAVRVWNVESGTPVGEPSTYPAESVRKVAFSPNGNWVVSGAYDGTVRVWSASSGQQLGDPIPTDQRSAAIEVAFSPDGDRILFGTDSGAMQFRPGPDGLSEQLCAKLWTNMSHRQWNQWVSPEIPYQKVCPELPVAEDDPLP